MTTLNVFAASDGVKLSFSTMGGDEVDVVMPWHAVPAFAWRLLDMFAMANPDERVGRGATGPNGVRGVVKARLRNGAMGVCAPMGVFIVETADGMLASDSRLWTVDEVQP